MPPVRSTFIFVRHCQSSGQAPDAALTAQGAADATALVARLAPFGIDALHSSPYLRAIQTIEPFAARRALPINIEFDLRERRLSAEPLGDWLDHIRRSFANFDYRPRRRNAARSPKPRSRCA